MAKGDTVVVLFHAGDSVQANEFIVTKGGRTLDVGTVTDNKIVWLEVTEKTRGGTLVGQSRFQLSEVVSYGERRAEIEK